MAPCTRALRHLATCWRCSWQPRSRACPRYCIDPAANTNNNRPTSGVIWDNAHAYRFRRCNQLRRSILQRVNPAFSATTVSYSIVQYRAPTKHLPLLLVFVVYPLPLLIALLHCPCSSRLTNCPFCFPCYCPCPSCIDECPLRRGPHILNLPHVPTLTPTGAEIALSALATSWFGSWFRLWLCS